MKHHHPNLNFNCLNNIYRSLFDVEHFLNCCVEARKVKRTYTLFKQWKRH